MTTSKTSAVSEKGDFEIKKIVSKRWCIDSSYYPSYRPKIMSAVKLNL